MVATFRFEQLDQAARIMNKYHAILKYSRIKVGNDDICVVEQGPMAAITEIRSELSNIDDLKKLKLI